MNKNNANKSLCQFLIIVDIPLIYSTAGSQMSNILWFSGYFIFSLPTMTLFKRKVLKKLLKKNKFYV